MMTKPTPLQTRNGGFNFPPPEQEYVEEQDPESLGASVAGLLLVGFIVVAAIVAWELLG